MGLYQSFYDEDVENYITAALNKLEIELKSRGISYDKGQLRDLIKSQIGDAPGEWELLGKNVGNMLFTPAQAISNAFFGTNFDTLFNTGIDTADVDSITEQLLRELTNAESLGNAPEVSLDSAMSSAKSEIDAEIAQQEKALVELLAQQTASYNDAAEQILSSDYQRNASLMGTYQSEMRRAQRNALEAGASAGARLANNINVTLSTQNRQAQQSLETSNNLAQMLLNQRQAASGIEQQRVGLRSGYTERVNAYGQQKYADQQTKLGEWETSARDKITGGTPSPYADYILAKRRNQQSSSTGTTSTSGT